MISCILFFFGVIPGRLKFMCRRFGTLCQFHLHMKMEQTVLSRLLMNNFIIIIINIKDWTL